MPKTQRIKVLLNIGTDDQKRLGLDDLKEGDEATVSAEAAAELIKRGTAEAVGAGSSSGASAALVSETGDSSSVSCEAIAAIETMRSKEKLQHIIDNDPRATVKSAARKRLEALSQ